MSVDPLRFARPGGCRARVVTFAAALVASCLLAGAAIGAVASPASAASVHVPVLAAADSVPEAGWFHVVGPALPGGTAFLRYSNVDRAVQTALARHSSGTLSFWFRAPGPPGSTVRIHLEALDASGGLLDDLGTIDLVTGNELLPLPQGTGEGRRVVLDTEAQQVWLVGDDGAVAASFLVSGRRIPTASGADQPGVFRVYSRSGTMRYCEARCGTARHMVRYQKTPVASVGFHSLPIEQGVPVQSADDLGWPLSHGCTRLEDGAATIVSRWATTGTVVIVSAWSARHALRGRSTTAGRPVL